ncbi:MAG: MlaD family protein [Rhodoferax sp.]|nr:MlaD family protein [Rhodoferax sp.]
METKVNLALVGAFVLALGAVLIGIVLWLASGGAWQQPYDLYLAVEEESVAGLNLNAPVKFNGVEIGKVRSITLDPDDPQRVNLLLAIARNAPIKQDTVAVLRAQGLTGIAYMELSGGLPNAPALQAKPGALYPQIATKSSLSTRLEDLLTRLIAKIDSSSGSLNGFLNADNQRAFSSALADLAKLSRTLAARTSVIDRAIGDAGSTLHNSASASVQLAPALQAVQRSAQSVDQLAASLQQTSHHAGTAFTAVGADAERLASQTLPQLERLMAELAVLSASLRRLSEQTERTPPRLLFGPSNTRPGPGEVGNRETRP